VVVVLGIVAVLSGLVFVLSSPARESARQNACVSNLKNIYAALMLYHADYPDGPVLGDTGVPLIPPDLRILRKYGSSLDIERCPDTPPNHRPGSSTYEWRLAAHWPTFAADKEWWDGLKADLALKGGDYPIVRCHIHDRVYYQAREKDDYTKSTQEFVIELKADGSVSKGRRMGARVPLDKLR
jgi:type II secretory pathway pseudopilin PulG